MRGVGAARRRTQVCSRPGEMSRVPEWRRAQPCCGKALGRSAQGQLRERVYLVVKLFLRCDGRAYQLRGRVSNDAAPYKQSNRWETDVIE